jgi:hypothetical protein
LVTFRIPAVAEVAAGGEGVNVGEGIVEAAFPQLDLAHPRGVDEKAAAGQFEQLAMRGGVPAARVGGPHFGGPLPLVAAQPVDQRRLADARRAEEGNRLADGQVGEQRVDALAALRAHHMDRRSRRDRLDLAHHRREVGGEVRLVEDDDRARAAVPGRRQVALDAAQVEVVVEAGDEEDGVDVRGDDLLLGGAAGDLAREPAAAGEQRLDGAFVPGRRTARHGDPVAHGRKGVAPLGLVTEAAPDPGQDVTLGGRHPIDLLVFEGDPAGDGSLGVGRKRRRERVVPPERPEAILAHRSSVARARHAAAARAAARWRPGSDGPPRRA